jgi:ubiquinone/menaquinone biosynthesis C-methylase UbiE
MLGIMSTDRDFYDNEDLTDIVPYFVSYIKPYASAWLPEMGKNFLGRTDVKILDLGAGSCTLSLMMSDEPYVENIEAVDISAKKMTDLSKLVHKEVGGKPEKLIFSEIDFNDPLPFADNSFDLVVMDAALHHSRNIWVTLSEIRRVLKSGGFFIAQREAYTSPLTHKITFRRILESPEAAAGVSENAYLKSQYDYYLRVNGFLPEFQAVLTDWKFKALFFLNGILFSKYNIIARSTKTVG